MRSLPEINEANRRALKVDDRVVQAERAALAGVYEKAFRKILRMHARSLKGVHYIGMRDVIDVIKSVYKP